jgi:Icc-related predicted phosphoesterase
MKILDITPPLIELPFLNAGRGPGGFYEDRLPVHCATVDQLPQGLCAIIATSDLQGRERMRNSVSRPLRLLGEVLPELLVSRILPELEIAQGGDIGIILAGDFYTVPALDRRGGSGDVTAVWQAFADQFAWVAGVAGNHDTFGDSPSPRHGLRNSQNVHYLDGEVAEVGGLRIAGIGGIIGNPQKLHRRTEDDYLAVLESLLESNCDVLVMHDGPDAPAAGERGSALVRELIELYPPTLVVRGHAHWQSPLVELVNGTQVLNVDARVVVLTCNSTASNQSQPSR